MGQTETQSCSHVESLSSLCTDQESLPHSHQPLLWKMINSDSTDYGGSRKWYLGTYYHR